MKRAKRRYTAYRMYAGQIERNTKIANLGILLLTIDSLKLIHKYQ